MEPHRATRWPLALVLTLTALLLTGAVYVRGLRGALPELPEDRVRAQDALAEPLQFLGRGAHLRLEELTPRIGPAHAAAWAAGHRIPFDVAGCPLLVDWLATADGQAFEQLVADLRRGSRDEALAALTLVFAAARTTEWAPGVRGSKNAERLAGLLQDWLRKWGEPAAKDELLSEPALGAALAYSRIMRLAYEAPVITRDGAVAARAKTFLETLTGAREPRLSAFGEALEGRYPDAFDAFRRRADLLEGLAREAYILFPELDGACIR